MTDETWQARMLKFLRSNRLGHAETLAAETLATASMLDDLQARQIRDGERLARIEEMMSVLATPFTPITENKIIAGLKDAVAHAKGDDVAARVTNFMHCPTCVGLGYVQDIGPTAICQKPCSNCNGSGVVGRPVAQPTPDPRDAVIEAARKLISEGAWGKFGVHPPTRHTIVITGNYDELVAALDALQSPGPVGAKS